MTESAPLRRLARRVHVRATLRSAGRRGAESLPAVIQIVVASVVSYSISHYLLGHPAPFIAVAVTITSLGLTRDARPRRVFDNALGVAIGITLSELLVFVVGRGVWQIAIVLFVVLLIARVFSPNPAFAVAAAVQSAIVVIVPGPTGLVFTRTLDAVVAGAVALTATALIPRNPNKDAARERRRLFAAVDEGIGSVVDCLRDADEAAGELGLARLRRTQPMIDAWTASLESAIAVARISPFLRSRLPELHRDVRFLAAADLAARHMRTLARRTEFLVRDGVRRPALAETVEQLGTGMRLIGEEADDPQVGGTARSLLTDVARRLTPSGIVPDGHVTDLAIVLMLRPLAVDLLVGTGMPIDEARALLPEV
ncbi:MAG: FUSC family protein [Rhodoglobus sp.]